MNTDTKNINTIEQRHKNYTKLWRTIYQVIQQEFFDETGILPDDFIKHCKDNVNEAHNIPIEVNKNIKTNVNGTRMI